MRILLTQIPLIFLLGCGEASIVGTWCESNDGGKSCFGHESFFESGEVSAWGVFSGTNIGYEMTGRYVKDGKDICLYPEYENQFNADSKLPVEFELVSEMCFEIIEINEETLEYKMEGIPDATMYRASKTPNKLHH